MADFYSTDECAELWNYDDPDEVIQIYFDETACDDWPAMITVYAANYIDVDDPDFETSEFPDPVKRAPDEDLVIDFVAWVRENIKPENLCPEALEALKRLGDRP